MGIAKFRLTKVIRTIVRLLLHLYIDSDACVCCIEYDAIKES